MPSLTSSTFRSGFDGARVLYRRHDVLTYLIHISVRMEQEYFTGGMMSSLTSSTFRSGFDGARVLYRRHDVLTYLIHISVRI